MVATARINQEQVPEYARVDWEYPAKDEGRDGAAHPGQSLPPEQGRGSAPDLSSFMSSMPWNTAAIICGLIPTGKIRRPGGLYKKLGYQERGIIPCTFNGIRDVFLVCPGKTDLEKDERQFMVKKTVGHFSLEQICDSGQCFRMEKLEKGEFLVLAGEPGPAHPAGRRKSGI